MSPTHDQAKDSAVPSSSTPGSARRTLLVVDTDPGADDAMALLYLAAQPQVELVAIGSVHGNVPAALAADNALRIMELLGLDVPVAVGANQPLNAEFPGASAPEVHGEDGLGGQAGPPPRGAPVAESAAEQLVRLARQHPGELTLLALGPLTNIALALRLEPGLPTLLREVVWMGGAITVPGNMSARAEANAWNDPEAADLVLRAGFALRMVPLDVTDQAWAGPAWLDAVAAHDGLLARSATAWIGQYVQFCTVDLKERGERGCLLHDPLAAVLALDPELAGYKEHHLTVELTGADRGATQVDQREPDPLAAKLSREPVRVAMQADVDTVLERMRQALLQPTEHG